MGLVTLLPNLFGMARFALAFVLLLLAYLGAGGIFIGVLIIAFILDAIDGPIARRLGQDSEQGARLDTVADFSMYMALVAGVWRLWPVLFAAQSIYIGMAALSMILPLCVALMKFRTFTSYHTWLVKFATVCMAIGTLTMLLFGPALPFRIACVISALGGLEQIAITLLLTKPKADVRHLLAVYRFRKDASVD